MAAIINKDDMGLYIPLAVNLDSQRIEMFAGEVEKVKCTELLGRELYKDIKTNPETDENIELIETLKPVLVYWTYVMYLEQGKIFNTATGAVIKRTDASIPLSDMELKIVIDANCRTARFYESELKFYLSTNTGKFPLWSGRSQHTGRMGLTIRVQ